MEGVVNILFYNTHLSNGLISCLDRLSTLQKYELILSYRCTTQRLDKGRKEIQAVDELLSIRDKNVHAKILAYDMREKALLDYEVDHVGKANILKIPLDSTYWTHEHSEIVLNATDDFFWLYFFDLCHMKNNCVAELLADRAVLPNGKKALVFADSHRAMFNMVRSHKRLNLKFLHEMAKTHNL